MRITCSGKSAVGAGLAASPHRQEHCQAFHDSFPSSVYEMKKTSPGMQTKRRRISGPHTRDQNKRTQTIHHPGLPNHRASNRASRMMWRSRHSAAGGRPLPYFTQLNCVSVVARPARVRRAPATKPTAQELRHSRRRPSGWIDASSEPTRSSRQRLRCRRR